MLNGLRGWCYLTRGASLSARVTSLHEMRNRQNLLLDGTVSRGGVKVCWFTEAMWRYEANDNTARTPTQEGRGDWRGITGIVSVT